MRIAKRLTLVLEAMCILLTGVVTTLFAIEPANIREPGPPIPTPESIVFSYKGSGKTPETVMVNGSFNGWEDPIPMTKNRHGVFICVFTRRGPKSVVAGEGRYTYRYLVDGVWTSDPANPNVVHDPDGTALSYFDVPAPIIIADKNPVVVDEYRDPGVRYDYYVFYYRNKYAREVCIVGDFNNWNPYSHPLTKNKNGIWEVVLDIPKGEYLYRFIVDGVFKTDPLNRNIVKDRFDNVYSKLELP